MLKITLASSRKRLWQRTRGKKKMRERMITPPARPKRNVARTVVGNFQDCDLFFFKFFHSNNFVEWVNLVLGNFYRSFFWKRYFSYLKTIKYKILFIAHKNIFCERIWGIKNIIYCLKTFIVALKKLCCAIIT